MKISNYDAYPYNDEVDVKESFRIVAEGYNASFICTEESDGMTNYSLDGFNWAL